MSERKVVIPGEILAQGNDYLPGEGTERRNEAVVSLLYGLAEETNKLLRVIPLSGVYEARKGNTVIGKVEMVTFNGWVVDIGCSENAFLTLSEVSTFINKNEIEEFLKLGDMLVAKILDINKRGIDLTLKSKGLGKIEEGIIININSNKVPRVIGKEGSMINLIKEGTQTKITVGRNGYIWINATDVEDMINAKKTINFVAKKSYLSGLTEEVKEFMEKLKKENGKK